MSFLIIPKKQNIKIHTNNFKRKENDSLMTNHFHRIIHNKTERASAFTSKGSITLEAALVLPLFFFAVLCLVYLLEMMAIQTSIRNALYSTGKDVAMQAYMSPVISTEAIEKRIVRTIGEERLAKSMVVGGASGIDCRGSSSDWNTAVINLEVAYKLEVPVLMFRIPIISKEETLRIKGWTGYVEGGGGQVKDEIVYVTEHGIVYHKDMYCTYLELAIRAISPESLGELRNQSGGKYYPCESCGKNTPAVRYYITDYGDRYHTTLECSKVKRNMYAVPLDEVYGLGGCSKCVK